MKKRILSILTALVLCLTLLPTAALAEEPTTLQGSGTEADPIVLTQTNVTANSTLTLESGKYYELGEDITIPNPTSYSLDSKAIVVSGNVTLNLNGYMLKGPGVNSSSNLNGAINIAQGATLTLEDNYANDRTDVTRYFDVDSEKGLWTLKDSGTSENSVTGGIITGFYGNNGGGVYNDGTFNMMGGTIVGCCAESSVILNDGNFNMAGGDIVGCVAKNTGVVKNQSTFTMDGGTIKNCAIDSNSESGIIYNDENAILNLVNGNITQCKVPYGGAIFVKAGGTFNVGGKDSAPGKVSITGNTGNNVYLNYNGTKGNYTAVNVTTAGLKTGSSIGINMSHPMDSFAIITNLTDGNKNYFSSDMAGYSLLHDNDGKAYLAENYRVTFDVNGGDALDLNYMATNTKGTLTSLPIPTSSGSYRFDGWFAEKNGGTAVTVDTVYEAHTTVYAHWTPIDYTITYYYGLPDDVAAPTNPTTYTVESTDITLTAPTWNLHSFLGWTYEGQTEPVLSVTIPTGSTGDRTYTANWKELYTVTFDPNGGTVDPTSATTDIDGNLTELPTPTRSGSYRFDGWFTEQNGGTAITVDTVFTEYTTVYAHWTYTGGSSRPIYAITVPDTEHGTVKVSPRYAERGDTVTVTVKPDEGYTLETLTVLDKNGNEIELTDKGDGKYTFKMPSGRVEVKATFAEDNSMLNFFVDVTADKYYYDAVLWAAENGITGGVDENHFGPDLSCTRAQLVTFLWRAAGCPVVNYAMNFSDVGDDYYTEAVRWAASLGIVGGYGNGLFGSDDAITREQFVTILYRFAVAMGYDVSVGEDTNILSYNDVFEVSEYAIASFQWATGAGVVQGNDGNLMPKASCTRAQIVTMLYRLLGA